MPEVEKLLRRPSAAGVNTPIVPEMKRFTGRFAGEYCEWATLEQPKNSDDKEFVGPTRLIVWAQQSGGTLVSSADAEFQAAPKGSVELAGLGQRATLVCLIPATDVCQYPTQVIVETATGMFWVSLGYGLGKGFSLEEIAATQVEAATLIATRVDAP
jgi:hypothetical protein